MKKKKETPKRGRTKSRILNIDATPEYAAQALFAAADSKMKKGSPKKTTKESSQDDPSPSSLET